MHITDEYKRSAYTKFNLKTKTLKYMKTLKEKLKALRLYIVRRSYSVWYGVNFESGFEYQKIKHSNLDLLERHHYLMLDMGWERYTDVDAGFSSAWCWYRKKK